MWSDYLCDRHMACLFVCDRHVACLLDDEHVYLSLCSLSQLFPYQPWRRLLANEWRGHNPLYNAVAHGLLWILVTHDNVQGIHYLDDYLLFGAPRSSECGDALPLTRCASLGLPVALTKTEGPTYVKVSLPGHRGRHCSHDPEPPPG